MSAPSPVSTPPRSRLPAAEQRRFTVPLTGSSLNDTLIYAVAHDCSQHVEGVVVDGVRDEEGRWDFGERFTVFTHEEELIVLQRVESRCSGPVAPSWPTRRQQPFLPAVAPTSWPA